MSDEATAAQIIDELLAGGEMVDSGSFTLDRSAAASKMVAFRYADRSAYLLPIVEAVHLLGARKVTVTPRGEDLLISAEGVDLADPAANLARLYDHAIGIDEADARTRALGRLGVGLDMALNYDSIERIGVSYSTRHETIVAEFRPRLKPRLARLAPRVSGELRLLMDRPWTSALSLGGASQAEIARLREAVRFSKHPVFLELELISQQMRRGTFHRRGKSEGFSYLVDLTQDDEPAVIELWSGGVHVDSLRTQDKGFVAEIHLDAPRRDLSQMKIIRDKTIESALEEIEHVHAELAQIRTQRRHENAQYKAKSEASGDKPDDAVGGLLMCAAGTLGGAVGLDMFADGKPWGATISIVAIALGWGFGGKEIAAIVKGEGRHWGFILISIVVGFVVVFVLVGK